MEKQSYQLVPVSGKPKLTMRYYKAKQPQKGIIVFVHGVSHGAWCWEDFVGFFTKEHYACFAVNLRGHGDNKRFFKGTLGQYVKDVGRCMVECKRYCKSKGISYSAPFILGHSMGGAIVEKYISKNSDHVRGAVLFAPVTAKGMGTDVVKTSVSKSGRCTIKTVIGFKNNKHLDISNFFVAKTGKKLIPRITDQEKLSYYNSKFCRESLPTMCQLIKFRLQIPDIPVFVIGTDTDAYFNADSLNATASFYGTKAMIIEGLCHDMMLDPRRKEPAQAVLEFLSRPDKLKKSPFEFIEDLERKVNI